MGSKRKSEMWISNNRVLVGGNKKVTGRNPNFDTEETKLLISLWGDPKVQKTLITTHKKHGVIVKLAEKMREYGYFRSPEEINTRIKNLKCFYNRIKKDVEMGITDEPTWKHFKTMDEIMTRPIFSVRPNEIPKPSLRYKMEEELRERETAEKNEKESDGSDEDEKISFTQEMFDDEMMDDADEEDEDLKLKKDEDDSEKHSSDIEETPLIIPKQEPIDVDDETEPENGDGKDGDNDDTENADIFPKLSAYLQLSSSTASSSPSNSDINKPFTTVAGNVLSNGDSPSITNALKLNKNQPIVITSQQATQGKISLVPTNFLLKPPQQQQIQIRPQTQHRILYTNNPNQQTQGIVTSGPGQVPMKVLLVNTLQKTPGAAVCTTTDSQAKSINVSSIQQNGIMHTAPVVDKNPRQNCNTSKSQKDPTGCKALLTQLVQIQNDALEVNRQRLELDKQRLDFEKSALDRILNALPNIFQQQPTPVDNMTLLIPKIERED